MMLLLNDQVLVPLDFPLDEVTPRDELGGPIFLGPIFNQVLSVKGWYSFT